MNYITEPFQYDFFGRALLVSVLIGALAGAIGPFVLVRRMAYIGQGMSQSVLGGVALGVTYGIDLYLGAAVAAALSAALIYFIRNQGQLSASWPQRSSRWAWLSSRRHGIGD